MRARKLRDRTGIILEKHKESGMHVVVKGPCGYGSVRKEVPEHRQSNPG